MIEAMKQWLEAFEIAAEGGGVNFHAYAKELRQAIAEFDSHTLYREGYVNGYAFGEAAGKQAIAKLESQETVAINWNAIYEKLELVWYRELSADEGLDEIQDLIDTHPPQRTEPLIGCVNHDCAKCQEKNND